MLVDGIGPLSFVAFLVRNGNSLGDLRDCLQDSERVLLTHTIFHGPCAHKSSTRSSYPTISRQADEA